MNCCFALLLKSLKERIEKDSAKIIIALKGATLIFSWVKS